MRSTVLIRAFGSSFRPIPTRKRGGGGSFSRFWIFFFDIWSPNHILVVIYTFCLNWGSGGLFKAWTGLFSKWFGWTVFASFLSSAHDHRKEQSQNKVCYKAKPCFLIYCWCFPIVWEANMFVSTWQERFTFSMRWMLLHHWKEYFTQENSIRACLPRRRNFTKKKFIFLRSIFQTGL